MQLARVGVSMSKGTLSEKEKSPFSGLLLCYLSDSFIPFCPYGPCFCGILPGSDRPLTFDLLKCVWFHIQLGVPTRETDEGNTLFAIFPVQTNISPIRVYTLTSTFRTRGTCS